MRPLCAFLKIGKKLFNLSRWAINWKNPKKADKQVGKVALLCMEVYMLRRKVQPQIQGHILYAPIYMIMCVR